MNHTLLRPPHSDGFNRLPAGGRLRAVLIGFAALLLALPLPAGTLLVTTTADSGAGSLRAAIQNAGPGDFIQFTVTGTITLTSGELVINRSLNLIGLGAQQLSISANNASRLLWISNSATPITVHLSGLTLRQGLHQGGSPGLNGQGGAVFNGSQSALTLSNCAFIANTARGAAGTSGTRPGGPGGHGWGGAIFNASNSISLTLVGCTFQDNLAAGAAGGNGINGGNAGANGGPGGQGAGGAIANEGSLRLINCTFSANQAIGGAGGNGGLGAIFDGLGGAGGPAEGGHIANRGGATAIHLTLTAGTANGGAGGASLEGAGAPGLARGGAWFAAGTSNAFLNSLLTANLAAAGGSNVFGPITSLGHNCIDATNHSSGWLATDLAGSAAAPLDPRLGPLADHGGPTLTCLPGAGSPVIDAADGAVLEPPYLITTDQRGVARQTGARPDIGAVEAIGCPPTALVEFTVDPSQSYVTLSGQIGGFPIRPQGPGSLTASYGGILRALVASNSIGFPGGSRIDAAVSGLWQPGPGGVDGTAPANYGAAAADSLGSFASYFAIRNLAFDVTSPCLPLIDGAFAVSGIPLQPVGDPGPTEDLRLVQPFPYALSYPRTTALINQLNTPGRVENSGGNQTLILPIHTEALLLGSIPGAGESRLFFDGAIIAHRVLEPPIVITHSGVTNGVFSMRWNSADARSYRVEATTNFVHWQTVASPILGTGNSTSWSTPATQPAQFFRVGRN